MNSCLRRRIKRFNQAAYHRRLADLSDANNNCRAWIAKIHGRWKIGGVPNALSAHDQHLLDFNL